jgi:hypothetical protein
LRILPISSADNSTSIAPVNDGKPPDPHVEFSMISPSGSSLFAQHQRLPFIGDISIQPCGQAEVAAPVT